MSARLLYATCKAHQKSLLDSRARYTVGAGWSIEPDYELAFAGAPTSGPHRNYVKIRFTDGKFVVYSDGKKIHTKIEIAPLRAFVNRALQERQDVDLGVNDDDSRRPWEIIRDLESSWVQLFADRTASKLPDGYNEAYHLTGDGVAVPVVRYLAKHLFEPRIAQAMAKEDVSAA